MEERRQMEEEGTMQAQREGVTALMASLSFRKDEDEGVVSALECKSPRQTPAAPDEPPNEIVDGNGDDSDGDLEFAFVYRDPETGLPISPDDMSSDGQICLVYPVFGRGLDLEDAAPGGGASEEEEREENPGGSTSEDVEEAELTGAAEVPQELYYPRTPGSSSSSSEVRCKKSNSTGSLLRWRIRDFVMGRSHSDGKEKLVFFSPEKRESENKDEKKATDAATSKKKESTRGDRRGRTSGDSKAPAAVAETDKGKQTKGVRGGRKMADMDMATAHGTFYKNAGRPPASGGLRQSFLPYKQDLFSFFTGANGLGISPQSIQDLARMGPGARKRILKGERIDYL